MKLILENNNPPIPTRAFDWVCYEEGSDDGLHGYGKTAEEALENWMEYHEV